MVWKRADCIARGPGQPVSRFEKQVKAGWKKEKKRKN